MKFLCITCDEQMRLTETLSPEQDAVSAVFTCPKCGHQIAMLTNSMETQLVKSLDVRIGGSATRHEPMSVVRSSLEGASESPQSSASGGKCPFTGAVKEAVASDAMVWTDGALQRLERVPPFIRPMVRRGIEDHAREQGLREITEEVMADVRSTFGM